MARPIKTTKDLTDYVSIDGQHWDHKNPYNYAKIQRDMKGDDNYYGYMGTGEGNQDAEAMYNPLYAFSRGAVDHAADVLGYKNINSQAEVDNVVAYLRTERASQDDLDALEERFDNLPSTPIDDVIPIEEEVAESAEPYVPSQELTTANEIVNDREASILDGSYSADVFGRQPDEEEAQTLAQKVADKFTLKLGGAMYQDPKNIERAQAALAYPFSPSLASYIS